MTLAIVSGSGICLDALLTSVDEDIPFSAAGIETGDLEGHERRFLLGKCDGTPLIIQSGRLHLYEGHDYETATRAIDRLKSFGATAVLFTNAAGGLRPEMVPGDLVDVDRIRMWRYRPWAATPGMLLPDFNVSGCDFSGTYQWVPGPSYETRAEIAAMQNMGHAAVGMSTAPELMRCQELNIPAGVIACITNSCGKMEPLSHDAVIAAARKASGRLARIIAKWMPSISRSI
jgi:purine-nucleoside phosphorylase